MRADLRRSFPCGKPLFFCLECLWTKACDAVILSMSRSVGLGENVLNTMNDLGPTDATRVCLLNILTYYALMVIYKYFDGHLKK